MDAAFKSEAYRLGQVKSVRELKGWPFFKDLEFGPGSLLPFKFTSSKSPKCRTEHICWFEHTQTSVQRLLAGKDVAVMKIYRLRDDSEVPHHDIEILMLSVFSRMMAAQVSPHFVLPIGRQLLTNHRANILTGRVLKDGNYSMILSEHADTSLSALLQQNSMTTFQLKALLFQVIYTLAAIQHLMPSFRHNDLHASNVLVQTFDGDQVLKSMPNACVEYEFRGTKFYIPVHKCAMRALLWDFFYASSQSRSRMLPTRHKGGVYSTPNR